MAKQKTIGVLIGYTGDRYHSEIWPAIMGICNQNKFNSIFFLGSSIKEPGGFDSQANVVYGLVGKHNVDGLIVIAGALFNYLSDDDTMQMMKMYEGIPTVTIARKVKDVINVTVENYTGMYDLVSHMIEKHNRKKIAFIRGPEMNNEAEVRYKAYREALQKHGIEFDESLVAMGTFAGPTGADAVVELVDVRKAKFDCLVAANDDMLMFANQELLKRDIRVPEDVSIGGFDNLMEAQSYDPPITTVEQPLIQLASKATEVLIDIINGNWTGQMDYEVPSALIVRSSCGCFYEAKKTKQSSQDSVGPIQTNPETLTNIKANRQNILERIVKNSKLIVDRNLVNVDNIMQKRFVKTSAQSLDMNEVMVVNIIRMIDAFIDDIGSLNDPSKLKTFVMEVGRTEQSLDRIELFYTVLFEFQFVFLEYLVANPVVYAYAVKVLLSCTRFLSELFKSTRSDENRRMWLTMWKIKGLTKSLSATFEINQIKLILEREISQMDIGACNITLYEDAVRRTGDSIKLDTPRSQLMFSYNRMRKIPDELHGPLFDTRSLVPFDLYTDYSTWYVLPLYYENLHFGLITIEMHPFHSNSIYMIHDILRDQISWAMKGVLLIKELTDTHNQLIEAVKSAKEANYHKSKVLVNMSHELRTPLNTINGITGLLQIGSYEKYEEIMQSLKKLKTVLGDIKADIPDFSELRTEIENFEDLINNFGNKNSFFFHYYRNRIHNHVGDKYPEVLSILDGIIGYLEEEKDETMKAYKHIKEAGIYLLGLIDMVLNLSKAETGKMEVFRTNVYIRQLMESVRVDAENYIRSQHKVSVIQVEFHVSPELPEISSMDKQKVKEVLLNFLSNAIKYTPEGKIIVNVRQEGQFILFSVKDNGMGIRDEDRAIIFTEFGRTNESKKIEGTGLGLVLSKKLIEMQDGEIGFESEYGKGSTFWFRIPLLQKI